MYNEGSCHHSKRFVSWSLVMLKMLQAILVMIIFLSYRISLGNSLFYRLSDDLGHKCFFSCHLCVGSLKRYVLSRRFKQMHSQIKIIKCTYLADYIGCSIELMMKCLDSVMLMCDATKLNGRN